MSERVKIAGLRIKLIFLSHLSHDEGIVMLLIGCQQETSVSSFLGAAKEVRVTERLGYA